MDFSLFGIAALGLELNKENAIIVLDNFCAFKSCQHGMIDFCWTNCHIISYAATKMLDAGQMLQL